MEVVELRDRRPTARAADRADVVGRRDRGMGRHAAYIVAVGTDVASESRSEPGDARTRSSLLLPWGDVFEDFLDRLGVSFEELRDEFVGQLDVRLRRGARDGGRSHRDRRARPRASPSPWPRCTRPTGAGLRLLPTSRAYAALRARRLDGRLDGRRDPRALARAVGDARRAVPRDAAAGASRSSSGRSAAPRCSARSTRIRASTSASPSGGGRACPCSGRSRGPTTRSAGSSGRSGRCAIRASAGLVVGARTRARARRARVRRTRREARAHRQPGRRGDCGEPDDGATGPRRARDPGGRVGRRVARSGAAVAEGPRRPPRRLAEARRRALRTASATSSSSGRERMPTRFARAGRREPLPGVHVVDEWVQDRARMRSILSAADVYAFPSRHEGLAGVAPRGDGVRAPGRRRRCDRRRRRRRRRRASSSRRDDADALAGAIGALLADDERRAELGRRARRSRRGALLARGGRRAASRASSSTGRRRDADRVHRLRVQAPGAARAPAAAARRRPASRSRCTSTGRRVARSWDEMVARCRGLDVTWLPRHRSQWGGFGHVRATLKGIDHVVASGVPFDYAVLLTGQDYPLRSPAEIAAIPRRGRTAARSCDTSRFPGSRGARAAASTGSRTGT